MENNLWTSISKDWLIWEWLLDWNANDTAWTNNWTPTNMVYVNSTVWYTRQNWVFNWSSSYVNLNTKFNLSASNKMSISILLNATSLTNYSNIDVFRQNANSLSPDFLLSFQWNWTILAFWVNTSTWYSALNVTITDSDYIWKWNLITATYDWANMRIYRNNILIWTLAKTWNLVMWATTYNCVIWRLEPPSTFYEYFSWNIKLARLYNKALSTNEIQLLYLEWLKKLWPSELPNYWNLLSGLVYYSDFKGTAHNLVDWVNWTVTGATLVADRFNNSNSAYNFTAWLNRIQSTISNNPLWASPRSHSNWMYITAVTTWYENIIWLWNTSTNNMYSYTLVNNWTLVCSQYWGSSPTLTTLSLNTWYHLVWVYNWTKFITYINWVKLATEWTYAINTTWTNIWIWALSTLWNTMVWKISDVMVWNRVLSANEVSQLYKLTSKDYIYPNKSYDLLSLRQWLVLDLNEQGKDMSWLANHGVLVNAPVVVRQWKAKWLSYNWSNQYVSLPALWITSNVTLSCWIYSADLVNVTKSWTPIWNLDQAIWTWSPCLQYSAWVLYLWKSYIANILSINITTLAQNNKWHNIIWTYNWTTAKLYLDWKLIASWAYSITFTWTCPMAIWRQWTWYYMNWKSINNKIRNRALSDKEIQALYYSQASNFNY